MTRQEKTKQTNAKILPCKLYIHIISIKVNFMYIILIIAFFYFPGLKRLTVKIWISEMYN